MTNSTALVAIAGLALLVVPTTSAMALTVTNKDSKEHTIGVDQGGKETVHKIPAGGLLDLKDECKDGCGVTGPWSTSVMLKAGDKYDFDGKSQVTISK